MGRQAMAPSQLPNHMMQDNGMRRNGQGNLPPWIPSGMGLPAGKNGGKLRNSKAAGRPKPKYVPNNAIMEAEFGPLPRQRNVDLSGQWNEISDNMPLRHSGWNIDGRESRSPPGLLDSYDFLDGDALNSRFLSHNRYHGSSAADALYMCDDLELEEYYARRMVNQSPVGNPRFDRYDDRYDGMEGGRGLPNGRRGDGRENRDARLWDGPLNISERFMAMAALEEEENRHIRQQQLRQQAPFQHNPNPNQGGMKPLYGKQQNLSHSIPREHPYGQEQSMYGEKIDYLKNNSSALFDVANGRMFTDGYQSHSPRSVQDFPESLLEISRRSPTPPHQGVYDRGLWRPLDHQASKQQPEGPSPVKTKRKEQSSRVREAVPVHTSAADDALSLPSQDEMDFFLASVQYVR